MTTIDQRDYKVIQTIYHFKQLPTNHIYELLFSTTTSKFSCYTTLNRLKDRNYINSLEHKLIGGAKGGSGPLVWTLASNGWRLFSDKPYRQPRAINFHTLEIGNTFLELVRLQRAGRFTIEGYATEPDAWYSVDGREVKPDLYVEIRQPSNLILKSNLEVDLGSEGEKKVKSKLADTAYAYHHADPAEFPVWPLTRWIACDTQRTMQLRRWINQLPEDERLLFKVYEKSGIGEMFS